MQVLNLIQGSVVFYTQDKLGITCRHTACVRVKQMALTPFHKVQFFYNIEWLNEKHIGIWKALIMAVCKKHEDGYTL